MLACFMSPIWNLAHPWLRDLVAYEPGKPIEDVARELGLEPSSIVKLASNENPLGPSPKALDAMRACLERWGPAEGGRTPHGVTLHEAVLCASRRCVSS